MIRYLKKIIAIRKTFYKVQVFVRDEKLEIKKIEKCFQSFNDVTIIWFIVYFL